MKRLIIDRIDLEEFKTILNEAIKSLQGSQDEFINVQQASEYCKIPITTLYEYTSTKKIPFHKKGKKLFFVKQELSDWMKNIKKTEGGEL
jgi:excisionase family DNA binding protein